MPAPASVNAFAGETVRIGEVENQIWQVSFLEYDLGYFDNERGRVEPGPNPFVPENTVATRTGASLVTQKFASGLVVIK